MKTILNIFFIFILASQFVYSINLSSIVPPFNFFGGAALAKSSPFDDFCNPHGMSIVQISIPINPLEDSVEQWLLWEETANLPYSFDDTSRPTTETDMPVCMVDTELHGPIMINCSRDISPALFNFFIRCDGQQILWPKHPDNTDPNVPFFDDNNGDALKARYTSSRTMTVAAQEAVPSGLRLGIKVPTNRFSPTYRGLAQGKTSMVKIVIISPLRWDMIEKINTIIGKPANLLILGEPLSIFVQETMANQAGLLSVI